MILHSQLVFQHSVVVSIFNPADATAYKVTTSSLSVEMEVVLHAVLWIASRGDSQTTHTDILTDSLSALKSGKWNGKSSVLPMPHPHFRLVSGNGSCHACCSLDCNVESVPQNWAVYISMKKERVQESPDWHVTVFGISTFKGDGGCAIMDRLESREMTQQTGWHVRMFNIYF